MRLSELVNSRDNFLMVDTEGRFVASKMGDAAFVPNGKFGMRVIGVEDWKSTVGFKLYVVELHGEFGGYVDAIDGKLLDEDAVDRMISGAEMLFGVELRR